MILRIALTAIMVASIMGVVALTGILPTSAQSAPNATRSFNPATVAPGGTVTVTIQAADYGLAGGVTETLPTGFAYVSSPLAASQVTELSGNQVRFTLQGEASFTYTVTASGTAGSHTFSGTLRDIERDDYPVGGASSVTVEAPSTPTPNATRSFNPATVAPGGTVTVTIQAADYGLAGGVTETLPTGFAYVSSPLAASQVTELSGNQVRFTLQGEASFTYTVTASGTAGSHTFSGTLRDIERDDYPVGGASSVTVEAPSTPTPNATRSFNPATVAPGGTVTVTIQAADYGLAGGVTETLPTGFAYVSSPLAASQVTELSGNQVRFTLQGEASFTYTVTASGTAGSHTFSGTLRDIERDDYPVGGVDTVTVRPPQPVPTPSPPANRFPVFNSPAAVSVAENTTTVVRVRATDRDRQDSVTGYAIRGGADSGKFSIVPATGELSFTTAPDFENPADAGANNEYVVAVRATSGEGGRARTATRTITITVVNVDEMGTVTLSSTAPRVGAAITASVTDPDGVVTGETWQWARSADGSTGWADTGATSAAYTPVQADEDNYLRATASYTDGEGSGKSAEAVSDNAVSAVIPGDTNDDGRIDKPEVIAAYRAYVADPSDKTEMIAIFRQYVADSVSF